MYRSKNRLGGKANTLGVIVDWLGDPYQATVCDGIERGAAHAGANLLLFVGGALPAGAVIGAPRHEVYDLAGRHNLDGLIVLSSTLSHHVGLPGIRQFCSKFVGLPLCSVGLPLPDAPSVTVDNEVGMSHVVRHVIEQHAARRIAFISGPPANAESQLRLAAYRAVLEQHGIPADEQLEVTGTFLMESGANAVRMLAKRLGPRLESLDAIVAANDNMAIGAMNELDRMGLAVPDRLAVTGFDDIEEARLTEPSLTTARQPLTRLGLEAVRRVLQGGSPSQPELDLRVGTEIVVRHSCGCTAKPSGSGSRSGSAGKQRFQLALMGQRERILAQLGRAGRGRFAAAGVGWEEFLLGGMVEDVMAQSSERFLPVVQRLTQRLGMAGVDLNALDEVIGVLRDELVPLLQGEPERHRHAEDLFHAARSSTSAALQRGIGRAHLELTRWARTIAVACNAVAFADSHAELRARLCSQLPLLGFRSCFISTYDAGDPQQARLLVSCDAAGAGASLEGKAFSRRELLPPELATVEGPGRSFAVLPLFGASALLGHVLFEYTAQHAFACGVLAEAISIALRNAVSSKG